jgi:hypothetical protein
VADTAGALVGAPTGAFVGEDSAARVSAARVSAGRGAPLAVVGTATGAVVATGTAVGGTAIGAGAAHAASTPSAIIEIINRNIIFMGTSYSLYW